MQQVWSRVNLRYPPKSGIFVVWGVLAKVNSEHWNVTKLAQ